MKSNKSAKYIETYFPKYQTETSAERISGKKEDRTLIYRTDILVSDIWTAEKDEDHSGPSAGCKSRHYGIDFLSASLQHKHAEKKNHTMRDN